MSATEDTSSGISGLKLTTFLFYAITTYVIITLSSAGLKLFKNKMKASHWAKVAQKKRSQRDQQIKQLSVPSLDISSSLQEKILNSDATTLLEMLKSYETTSEQILITYFQRATTIGLDLGLITEINFEEALAKARECDLLRRENPAACKGLLFGLPITVKDAFILKGVDASGGMASRLFKPASDDGLLVKLLKGEGAIPFAKTNIPQAMMIHNSTNHIWGTCKNPWNKNRSTGGSSGGEGAVIAARCSPMGLGNDIGGSIRIPALFCGVVGFKPTAERITKAGTMEVAPTLDNIINMKVATGPIVKSARDANLMMKVLLNNEVHEKARLVERDPYYIKKDWQEDLVNQKPKGLRIGYFKSVEFFPASPANQRAVEEAAKALKNRGYDVVEVEFPSIEEVILLYLEIMSAEGEAKFLSDALQGEASIEDYDTLRVAALIPTKLRKPLKWLVNQLGEVRAGKLVERASQKNAYEFLCLAGRQAKARADFFKTWEEQKLDALLTPGFGHPAQKLGDAKDTAMAACYTFMFNVLNLPTGALPVTVVKKGEDSYPANLTKYHDFMYKKTAETMEGSEGLPVGVQISTLPWQEEKCLSIMLALEEELQFAKKHPLP